MNAGVPLMKRWTLAILPLLVCLPLTWTAQAAEPVALEILAIKPGSQHAHEVSVDAVVEAVRQATLSTQVPGAVVSLLVKAGDRVRAGQELARIDARVAQQQVVGSTAQLEAAQAQLRVAAKELERQQQLFQKQYISQGALDRAQAQWEASQAQVQALQAQTRMTQTQTGFFIVQAPFNGVVSDVPVTLGDMAMPGRPLVVMHDPALLRVTAHVAQALMSSAQTAGTAVRYEVVGQGVAQATTQVQWLPTVDATTHTVELRVALPVQATGLSPGMFARVWLPAPTAGASAARVQVPQRAVVRRAEMTGVYVLDAQNRPRLRQVRVGAVQGELVDILSGVMAGDQVVLNPARVGAAR
jgi:RND family efflux transporter MFP subunit